MEKCLKQEIKNSTNLCEQHKDLSPDIQILSANRNINTVIVEGFLLYCSPIIFDMIDKKMFITIPKEICYQRRYLFCFNLISEEVILLGKIQNPILSNISCMQFGPPTFNITPMLQT